MIPVKKETKSGDLDGKVIPYGIDDIINSTDNNNTDDSKVHTRQPLSLHDIRRQNLRDLIDSKYEGNRSQFSRAVGKNVNLINLILSSNLELRRNLGERMAREIEKGANLPEGWLDADHRDPLASHVVSIPVIPGAKRLPHDRVLTSIVAGEQWLAAAYPTVDKVDNLRVLTMRDDSMSPTIQEGDVVVVDMSVNKFTRDGVYLIGANSDRILRRIQQQLDGTIVVRALNEMYDTTVLTKEQLEGLHIIAKAIGFFHHTRL